MADASTFMGLDGVAWSALSAVGTMAAALIALGALAFIAVQIAQSNAGQLGGLVQRSVDTLLRHREGLYRLQHTMKAGTILSWGELRDLRTLIHAYAFLGDSVKSVARLTPNRERGVLVAGYLTDLSVLADVAKHALGQARSRLAVFSADINKMLNAFFKAVDASAEDRKDLQELVARKDTARLRVLMTALSTKKLMSDGRSASAAVEILEESDGRNLDDALNAMVEHGGDKENAVLASAIIEELGEALKAVHAIPGEINRILQKKSSPLFFWKRIQNA